MNRLKGTRRFFWLAGMAALLVGVLVFLLLPVVAPPPDAGQPDIRVPKMENLPPEGAPLRLAPDGER